MSTELELDYIFWNAIKTDVTFSAWFLGKTKFAGRSLELKTDELWHQRWYRDPDSKEESETDILLIFRDTESGEVVSIHLENKRLKRAWGKNQAESYRRRAANWMVKWKHADSEVALMAPLSHIANHPIEAGHFDFVITYEEVGMYVSEFKDACM
jgi:hypothetical protein